MNNAQRSPSAESAAETASDRSTWARSTAPAPSRSNSGLTVRDNGLRARVHRRSRPGAGRLRRRDRLQPGPRDARRSFVDNAGRSPRSAPLDILVIGAGEILIVDRHVIRRPLDGDQCVGPIISRFSNTAINNVGGWIDSAR